MPCDFSPSCVCAERFQRAGAKTADLFVFFFFFLLQADKKNGVGGFEGVGGGCEHMCAAESVIKMETFAPHLL